MDHRLTAHQIHEREARKHLALAARHLDRITPHGDWPNLGPEQLARYHAHLTANLDQLLTEHAAEQLAAEVAA